jgi:Regulator of competence-specific genes
MKEISYKRIYQSQEYLSPLGAVRCRTLFGGYSLAVDDAVFAMVSDGELYLRACEETAPYQSEHPGSLLTLRKRGGALRLNYFQVDEGLWQDHETLLMLSAFSLRDAQRDKNKRVSSGRLKDLPNLSFHMELLLQDVGITDVKDLRRLGSKAAWKRLRKIRRDLNVSVLLSLEGALCGIHAAALPLARRQALISWAGALDENTPAVVG